MTVLKPQYLSVGKHSELTVAVSKLSAAFSDIVRRDLAEHLEEIVRINEDHKAKAQTGICATHDFCDANEIMADAFVLTFDRPIDLDDQDDVELWNAAWALSYDRNFKE
jgi:hypothetical protein